MSLLEWLEKHPRPKRADLKKQILTWLETVLPKDVGSAQLSLNQRSILLKALTQIQDVLQPNEKGMSSGASGNDSEGNAEPPAARSRFVGQSEFGPVELAEHVPEFPYWDEMLRHKSKRLPEYRHVPQKGQITLDKTSAADFKRGKDGSAFAGLIQLATRMGEAADRVFLIPLFQDDAELQSIPFTRKRVSYGTSGSKLLSPHATALQGLIRAKVFPRKIWHKADVDVLNAEQNHHEAGCFLGFFLVRGQTPSPADAYLNFTCASLNRYATGVYSSTGELTQAGGPELPLSFALRVHGLLGKLA